MFKKFKIFWKKFASLDYSPRYARLMGDLESFKPQLNKRIADTGSEDAEWAKQAKKLLEKTRDFLDENKIDEGWKVFHTAKRMEIYGMNDEERKSLANELRKEAAKLKEWRAEAVLELIGKTKEEQPGAPSPAALAKAVDLKDEHYNNQYYKNKLSRSLFNLLFTFLFTLIAGIVIYFFLLIGKYGPNFDLDPPLPVYILGVLLFGFLGAITSAILFTRYLSDSTRITELGSSRMITVSKIFVGAAFSLFIFFLLRSSVAENIQIFSFTIERPVDYFAVAFVSGFSEKLAQKAIETVVGKDNDTAAKNRTDHET